MMRFVPHRILQICADSSGAYVDGSATLDPAKAINTGTVSVTPTFNNDQSCRADSRKQSAIIGMNYLIPV